jgi:hypothetical protein
MLLEINLATDNHIKGYCDIVVMSDLQVAVVVVVVTVVVVDVAVGIVVVVVVVG